MNHFCIKFFSSSPLLRWKKFGSAVIAVCRHRCRCCCQYQKPLINMNFKAIIRCHGCMAVSRKRAVKKMPNISLSHFCCCFWIIMHTKPQITNRYCFARIKMWRKEFSFFSHKSVMRRGGERKCKTKPQFHRANKCTNEQKHGCGMRACACVCECENTRKFCNL